MTIIKISLKQFIILISLFIYTNSFGQNSSADIGTVNFLFGLKSRITPIYLERIPDFIHLPNIDVLEQPDMYLSGPGLSLTEKLNLRNNWSVNLNQTIRYDYIYQRLPLEFPTSNNFKYVIGKKIIFDFYADLEKIIPSKRKSYFSILIGGAICGLNSDFTQTLRVYTSQTTYFDFPTKKDFIFPAISSSLGWTLNDIYCELKFGYCWNNPTLYDKPFIFPEINVQYNFSNLIKRKN